MAARRASGLGLLALLAVAGCARDDGFSEIPPPETQLETYEVVIEGAPPGDIEDVAEEALQVYLLQEDGAPSRAFLRRRALGDVDTLKRLLRSRGYYEGSVEVALSRPDRGGEAAETPGEVVTVTFRIAPGPVYTLAAHRLETGPGDEALPPLDPAEFGSPVGGPAAAAPIVSAEDAAVGALRRAGFAYARFVERSAVADPEAKTIEVTSRLDPGLRYRIGAVSYEGVSSVPEEYLRTLETTREGEVYDGAKLRDFQRRLLETGLFTAVRVEPPEDPPPANGLPIRVTLEERKPRTVAAGIRYDSSEGPEVYGRLTHRNLLGRNEEATIETTAGLEFQEIAVSFRKPQFRRDRQALVAGLDLSREDRDAYDALQGEIGVGLERRLSRHWSAGVGLSFEVARIDDAGVTSDVFLWGVPAFVEYDSTDDPLDPKRGIRSRLELTPLTGDNDADAVAFVVADLTASTYFALSEDGAWVLALRGRLGSVLGEDLPSIPVNHRLYAGGGASVRGYALDFIGPLDAQNDPVGGRSALELGAEIRARVWGDIGGVLFIEAGSVSPRAFPDFDEGMQVAAGLGLRYYSPVGPLRFDVGFPLNGRDADDPFQFYLAIGQAF